MLDEICATLGGRAAEELVTGHISSGALNDLETVTKRSYGMVAYLGMSDELSNLCYYDTQEYNFTKPYSEKTAEKIDAEVHKLVNEQYARAKQLLMDNKEKHAALAQLLIEREVIFTEDVERIFGPRPWKSRADVLLEEEQQAKQKSVQVPTDNVSMTPPAIPACPSAQSISAPLEQNAAEEASQDEKPASVLPPEIPTVAAEDDQNSETTNEQPHE